MVSNVFRRLRVRMTMLVVDESGMSTVEYAIGTIAAAAFGASGATCWRRLKEWHEAGVWQRLHELILAELRAAGRLDLSAGPPPASRAPPCAAPVR